jgi:hypothetical protein
VTDLSAHQKEHEKAYKELLSNAALGEKAGNGALSEGLPARKNKEIVGAGGGGHTTH